MEPITKQFVFKAGNVSSARTQLFLTQHLTASAAGAPNAQVFMYSNMQWSQMTANWDPVAIDSMLKPTPMFLAIGKHGEVLINGAKGILNEQIEDRGASPHQRGPLRGLRAIPSDGTFFAVGMGRQVYQRLGDNRWVRAEEGLPATLPPSVVIGFNATDGPNAKELYAVGWGGEMWSYDGSGWTQLESPTNVPLFDVIHAEDGDMFACGKHGVILRGKANQWKLVDYAGDRSEARSLAWFKGKLYVADGFCVRVLDAGKLSVVDFGVGATVPAHQLHARGDLLLSVAGKELYLTSDGTTWQPIPC